MNTEAAKRAKKKYAKAKLKNYGIQCHVINDGDIIQFLDSTENKNALIKYLIREYIKTLK